MNRQTSTTKVRKAAPPRDPDPRGLFSQPGGAARPSSEPPPAEPPALGSPTLVPPVSPVTGGLESLIMFARTTSMAAICWPTPVVPSHFPLWFAHLNPHSRPLSPPVHCATAAFAEFSSRTLIRSKVHGAHLVVAAIHRLRNALNDSWSMSQRLTDSHATSIMTLFSVLSP